MTAEPDLLPLPSVLLNWPHPTNHAAIRDYARANLAELQREVEALRALAEQRRILLAEVTGAGMADRARAERLAGAGRRVTAAFRALGEATAWTRAAEQARHECEAAMLALDAVLHPTAAQDESQ